MSQSPCRGNGGPSSIFAVARTDISLPWSLLPMKFPATLLPWEDSQGATLAHEASRANNIGNDQRSWMSCMPELQRVTRHLRHPSGIAAALVRRLIPRHPTLGFAWVTLPDGSVTFRERGFVAAGSPAELLARHNYETTAIRQYLTGTSAESSLEIGCGYGRLTPSFASFSEHHIGVDINASALTMARRYYPAYEFHMASVTHLPFPDEHFDLITTWTVLQHIPPPLINDAALEISRVLRADGTLLICEETRNPDEQQPRQHTWPRRVDLYTRMFPQLHLVCAHPLDDIEAVSALTPPGHVMKFHKPLPAKATGLGDSSHVSARPERIDVRP